MSSIKITRAILQTFTLNFIFKNSLCCFSKMLIMAVLISEDLQGIMVLSHLIY